MSSLQTSDAPAPVPPSDSPPAVSPKDFKSARAAGIVGLAVMCSRVLGLARDQIFSGLFGANAATDAYNAAFRAPNLLRDLFAEGALSTAFITTFSKKIQQEGDGSAWKLANKMATLTLVFMSGVTVLGIVLSPQLIGILGRGFEPDQFAFAVSLTRIMYPFILLVSLAALAMGMLNAKNVFGAPAMASSFFNVGSIIGGVGFGWMFDHRFGPHALYGMAIGTLLGGFLQLAVQVPPLYRNGFRFKPDFAWRDPGVRTILRLMGPAVIAASAVQVNVAINSSFASFQPHGAPTWLNNAFRLMQLPLGVFGVAIATVTLPLISKSVAAGDDTAFRLTLARALRLAFFLTIPSTVGLICLGGPIISLLYQHGAFDARAAQQTGAALQFYAIGLAAYSGIKVLAPAFYAIDARTTPMTVSFIAIGINVVLNTAFTYWFDLGHRGLALSTSVTAVVNFTLLYVLMRRRVGSLETKLLTASLGKIAVASALLAVVCLLGQRYLLHDFYHFTVVWRFITLFGVIAAGAGTFFAACYALHLDEMREAVGIFAKRLRRQKRTP